MFKNYNEAKFLSNCYITSLAIFNALTGLFLIMNEFPYESPVFLKLQELMPLNYYGIILFTSAILLLVSLFVGGKNKRYLIIVGGLLGAIGIALYASASSLGVDILIVPTRYSLLSISNLLLSLAGGITLWQIRKEIS